MSNAAGTGGVMPPEKYRFTSEYQPSPEAKSRGHQRWAFRKQLVEDMFAELTAPVKLAGGEEMPGLRAMITKLRHYILDGGDRLTPKQVDALLRVLDLLLPKENKTDVNVQTPTISQSDLLKIMAERIDAGKRRGTAGKNSK